MLIYRSDRHYEYLVRLCAYGAALSPGQFTRASGGKTFSAVSLVNHRCDDLPSYPAKMPGVQRCRADSSLPAPAWEAPTLSADLHCRSGWVPALCTLKWHQQRAQAGGPGDSQDFLAAHIPNSISGNSEHVESPSCVPSPAVNRSLMPRNILEPASDFCF